MSTTAMKQALEALESYSKSGYVKHEHPKRFTTGNRAITALRAAIAEQEKCEPVGWLECVPNERSCDHLDEFNEVGQAYADGWNACRKAMLQAAPKEMK